MVPLHTSMLLQMTEPGFFLVGANFVHLPCGAAGGGELAMADAATPTIRGSGQVAAPAPMPARPSPSLWTSSTPPYIAGSCSSAGAPQAPRRLGWAGHLTETGGRMGVAAPGGGWLAAASAWRRPVGWRGRRWLAQPRSGDMWWLSAGGRAAVTWSARWGLENCGADARCGLRTGREVCGRRLGNWRAGLGPYWTNLN
jgi:hypothetical protein